MTRYLRSDRTWNQGAIEERRDNDWSTGLYSQVTFRVIDRFHLLLNAYYAQSGFRYDYADANHVSGKTHYVDSSVRVGFIYHFIGGYNEYWPVQTNHNHQFFPYY